MFWGNFFENRFKLFVKLGNIFFFVINGDDNRKINVHLAQMILASRVTVNYNSRDAKH